jgi:uncharacterized protein
MKVLSLISLLSLLVFIESQVAMSSKNVLGGALQRCSTQNGPITGYFRDGYCRTDASDRGRHVVAAIVTSGFLNFTLSRGNDLITPRGPSFPGLKHGDRWCLCALRWKEAYETGIDEVIPKVVLESTHESALKYVDLEALKKHVCKSGDEIDAGMR